MEFGIAGEFLIKIDLSSPSAFTLGLRLVFLLGDSLPSIKDCGGGREGIEYDAKLAAAELIGTLVSCKGGFLFI